MEPGIAIAFLICGFSIAAYVIQGVGYSRRLRSLQVTNDVLTDSFRELLYVAYEYSHQFAFWTCPMCGGSHPSQEGIKHNGPCPVGRALAVIAKAEEGKP